LSRGGWGGMRCYTVSFYCAERNGIVEDLKSKDYQ
jgi:hypothetical protein